VTFVKLTVPPQSRHTGRFFDIFFWSSVGRFFFFLVAPTLGSLLPLLEHMAEFPQFLDQG
jgi:hypothetical protein